MGAGGLAMQGEAPGPLVQVPRGPVCLRPAIRGGCWWPRHSGAAGGAGEVELAATVTFSQGRYMGHDGNEDMVVVLG